MSWNNRSPLPRRPPTRKGYGSSLNNSITTNLQHHAGNTNNNNVNAISNANTNHHQKPQMRKSSIPNMNDAAFDFSNPSQEHNQKRINHIRRRRKGSQLSAPALKKSSGPWAHGTVRIHANGCNSNDNDNVGDFRSTADHSHKSVNALKRYRNLDTTNRHRISGANMTNKAVADGSKRNYTNDKKGTTGTAAALRSRKAEMKIRREQPLQQAIREHSQSHRRKQAHQSTAMDSLSQVHRHCDTDVNVAARAMKETLLVAQQRTKPQTASYQNISVRNNMEGINEDSSSSSSSSSFETGKDKQRRSQDAINMASGKAFNIPRKADSTQNQKVTSNNSYNTSLPSSTSVQSSDVSTTTTTTNTTTTTTLRRAPVAGRTIDNAIDVTNSNSNDLSIELVHMPKRPPSSYDLLLGTSPDDDESEYDNDSLKNKRDNKSDSDEDDSTKLELSQSQSVGTDANQSSERSLSSSTITTTTAASKPSSEGVTAILRQSVQKMSKVIQQIVSPRQKRLKRKPKSSFKKLALKVNVNNDFTSSSESEDDDIRRDRQLAISTADSRRDQARLSPSLPNSSLSTQASPNIDDSYKMRDFVESMSVNCINRNTVVDITSKTQQPSAQSSQSEAATTVSSPITKTKKRRSLAISKTNNNLPRNTSNKRARITYGNTSNSSTSPNIARKKKGISITPGATLQTNKDATHPNSRKNNVNDTWSPPWNYSGEDSCTMANNANSCQESNNRRKTPRRSCQIKSQPVRSPEIVDMVSDSEDDDGQVDVAVVGSFPSPKFELDLTRIAFGRNVCRIDCQASYDRTNSELKLLWRKEKRRMTRGVDNHLDIFQESRMDLCSLQNLFSFSPTSGDFTVTPVDIDEKNKLRHNHESVKKLGPLLVFDFPSDYFEKGQHRKTLKPNDDSSVFRYLVLECRSEVDRLNLFELLAEQLGDRVMMHEIKSMNECCKYAASLLEDTKKQKNEHKRNVFVSGRASDVTLLVYPFTCEAVQIEDATKGLTEAAGCISHAGSDDVVAANISASSPKHGNEEEKVGETKLKHRRHYVSITVEDYERLDPGEWLNDSLIDFWMQWISRKDPLINSKNHFFTSHFYSTLSENGPKAVASWTRRKKINVFEKKLIFVPINKHLHWSLCVVVNPGALVESGLREPTKDDPLSCIIFMDSLRMHDKKTVAGHIRKWLNNEWNDKKNEILPRNETTQTPDVLFKAANFKIFSPKVPYQDNTYDCGIFACRYAYAIYELRDRNFTYGDAGMYCDQRANIVGSSGRAFRELISDGAEFDFNMSDIARFREEFKTLIERLSEIYKRVKFDEEQAEWRQKKEKQQQKQMETSKSSSSEEHLVAPNVTKKEAENLTQHIHNYREDKNGDETHTETVLSETSETVAHESLAFLV